MNGTGFRGRGCVPRGRKPRGLVTRIGGTRIPQPNFIRSNRESHVPTSDFWLEHSSPSPWQQMNGPPPPQPPLYSNFESHRYRGRPQFCTGLGIRGNGKKIRGEGRPRPGILPTPGFRGIGVGRPSQSQPLRFPPPLGSEEERQQKIAETADKIKQKLSLLGIGNTVNFWEDDVRDISFSQTEEYSVTNKAIPELKHDPPELDLTVNDFKDIGRVDPDTTASLSDSVEVIIQKNSKPAIEKDRDNRDSNAWDDARHNNIRANTKESPKVTEKLPVSCRLAQNIECAQGTVARHRRELKDSHAEPTNDKSDQMTLDGPIYTVYDQQSSASNLSCELSSNQTEKDKNEVQEIAAKASDLKPEFNKVREKLREVIKVERQNEKEGTAGPPPDNRTTLFQHTTGPRLQPPVRLDFHPGIRPRVPRFQGAPHFRPPFRPEHGIDMRPNFRPDFPPRFNHGPKNFNISPRLQGPQIILPEFNGRAQTRVGPRQMVGHSELNMQLNFDPREPPPRFNAPVFNPNELPPKFCPPSSLNGFQPPSGFYQNGPPPRLVNQDQNSGGLPPSFPPNLGTSSPVTDFSQLMPPSYNQISQMHCSSYALPINGGFNPAMPPPNPAPCIIPKFPPPSVPSSASSSSCSSPFTTEAQSMMQLPPIPINALEIQPPPPPPPHPPPVPPPPPPSRHLDNVPDSKDERHFSQENDSVTPNMKDELEEMQEALEFAKQFMNMSNDETEDDTINFNTLMFPDLTPIPATHVKHEHVKHEPSACESGNEDSNKKAGICRLRDVEQSEEFKRRVVFEQMITTKEFLMEEQEDEQLVLDVQIRPRVVFNVNSRSKKIKQINEWQNQNNEDSIRHRKSTEKVFEFPTVVAEEGGNKNSKYSSLKEGCDGDSSEKRNNQKNSLQHRSEDKERDTKTSQGSSGSPITIMDSNCSPKDTANDSTDQNRQFRGSSLKLSNKSLLTSTVDANWKDKVINQFLKMSKNDICNMVNSSGLRKFDIAMKHLVKERKYSLSQERRCSADDAIKGYDMSREEFMSQLSAMLDPSATVDIKNLPSKFIQHLSEVLKLDVESHLSDTIESWPAPSSIVTDNMDVNYNNGSYNDQNNLSESNNQRYFCESLDSGNFPVHIKPEIQPIQAAQISTDFSNLFIDRQFDNNPIASLDNNDTFSNQTAMDDISSAGIAESKFVHESVAQTVAPTSLEQETDVDKINGQFFPHDIIRVRGLTTMQISEKNLYRNDMPSSRSQNEIAAKTTADIPEEISEEKHEDIEGWDRKKRQDPDMFRNLTKEEWEAKYSISADCLRERELISSRNETSPRNTSSPRSTSVKDQQLNRNQSAPSSLKEMNWNASFVPGMNDDTHKWPRLKDYDLVADSDTDKGSNYVSRSIDSDRSAPCYVTKSLKVIESREKIAKNMSVNQRTRDDVSAEVEPVKRKSREYQKECKIRNDDSGTNSKESRDKEEWNNSGLEIDHEAQMPLTKDKIKKEVPNGKEIECEKDEMVNNIENVRLSQSNPGLLCPEESDKRNFQEQEREQIEFPGHSKCFTNDQDMLVAQDYITSSAAQESPHEIPPNEALQSIDNKVCEVFNNKKEAEQSESSMPTENNLENFDHKEIKNTFNDKSEMQSSKFETKKIDIQAYKARKLQRNNEKQDDELSDIETGPSSLDNRSEENIKEKQYKETSENTTGQSKNECKQIDSSDSNKLIKSKELQSVSTQNSTRQYLHKDRSSAPKLNSEETDERKSKTETKLSKHQNSEKSKEELHRDEKFDKKRSRNYSRDSHRSKSREDNRSISREDSKRSFQKTNRYYKSENKSRSKSRHGKNKIFESKDKKSEKHRTGDIPKEIHERIEKREKNKRTIAEDKLGHKRAPREHYDAKKKINCDEPSSARHMSDKILTNTKTVEDSQQKDDIVNNKTLENLTPVIDPINLGRMNEKMPNDVTQILVTLEVSEVTMGESTKSSRRNIQTAENDLSLSQAEDISDVTNSRETEDSSNFYKEAVTGMNRERIDSHFKNLQEDAGRLSPENRDHSVRNDTKDCSVTNKVHREKATDNSDLAHTKAEHLNHEAIEKIEVLSKFNSEELNLSSQSDENEVKSIIDHLIQRVISQLDCLNKENECRGNILKRSNAEITISSPMASKFGLEEPSESATLDLNSPRTPESPLKGFSEETIKNSILGKRKLAQSVLKITKDYIQTKDSEDFDNTVLKIFTESDTIDEKSEELTSYSKSEEIDALSAVDRRLENVYIETETKFGDDGKCCNKSECNERLVDQEIESIIKENENNPDTTTVHEEYKTCARSVTPSGDTLSLGSSIDFDNSEFIVLSEISSDENFSQDEERKRDATLIPENKENINTLKLNTERENLEETEGGAISNFTSQKDNDTVALTIAPDMKLKANRPLSKIHSSSSEMMGTNVKDLTESHEVDVFGNSSQSEMESNRNQDHNTFHAAETNAASVLEECKAQPFRETENSSETILNDGGVSLCCDSIQSDNPVIEKDIIKVISLIEGEADCDRTRTVEKTDRHVESGRRQIFNLLSKTNLSSCESNANKNIRGVKRTHKTKHKKNKKRKLDEKKIRESLKDKDMVTVIENLRTKEAAMARMAEIDIEIHKLMSEKMKINQILESGMLSPEKSLTGKKDDLSILESAREPDTRPPNNNENDGTSARLTKVDSKTKLVSSHSKFSKNITSNTLEDDIGNRENGKEEEKKKKKRNKRDRSSSKDNSIPETESRSVSSHKSSPRKLADTKSSVTRKEKSKKDNSSQSNKQQEEENSSSILQYEKNTTRIDKEITLAKSTDQATLNESLFEPCYKSTKINNHVRSQKRVNKIADSIDDITHQLKKERHHSEVNDKIKLPNKTGCGFSNDTTGKQLPGIDSDEIKQESGYLEQEEGKTNSKSQVSLEELYNGEKTDRKKRERPVFFKRRKGTLKCSSKSNSRALSPSEEEMPLQLLYIKKFHQKLDPLKSAESSSGNNKTQISNTKLKRKKSTNVLEHVMEVIEAVVKNKIGECRKSNKTKIKSDGTVDAKSEKVRRKEKILKKMKQDLTHMPNRSAAFESEGVWSAADLPNGESRSSCGTSLDENGYRNNLTEYDDLNGDKNGVASSVVSMHESDNKSSIDKVGKIPGECSGSRKIANTSSKSKAMGVKEYVGQVSPFRDFYEEEDMGGIFHGENETDILSEQWNIAEDETFNYADDVPQFLNSNSDLIPQDSTSHSKSASCNFNMEKGLDIYDLMLETVADDFEKTSKNLPTSGVQKREKKRVVIEDRESGNNHMRKRVNMTRSEMMNCSVRLVDCKYTHLKNYSNSCPRRKANTFTIISNKSTEFTYSQKCNGAHPSQMRNTIESYAHTAKSKGYFLPELTPSKEPNATMDCPDWSFAKPQLIDDDKIVLPLGTKLLTSSSDLALNKMKKNYEHVDNDSEIIKSQTSSRLQSFKEADEKITKAGNSRYSDEMSSTNFVLPAKSPSNSFSTSHSRECDGEVTVILDTQGKNSLKCEVNTSAARKQLVEYRLRAKPLSKLVDPEVHHREANTRKIENIKDRLEASEKNATEEEEIEQNLDEKKTNDIQIINQLENREDNEVQEVELPRIQYSVHKGPILDLKVYGDSILAASEDGIIYRYSQTCNGILNTYEGHKSAVTCMYVLEVDSSGTMKDWLFSGSLDGSLRCYDIKTSMQIRGAADVGSSIQCMDQSWGVIFLGTKSGYVSRFHIKANAFRGDEIKFSEEAVLGLKATTEGPRRVLIVASRNQPITIRDAQSGLLIRTISGHKSHTVYSLLMDSNLVYCGTSSTAIPVFDFINGSEIKLYNAGPGIVCMRMYKKLLFAGCYDGNIYVFDTKEQKIVCSIPGPGNMLLSMDIVDKKIVAGSKDRRLHMWQMPEQVHTLLAART